MLITRDTVVNPCLAGNSCIVIDRCIWTYVGRGGNKSSSIWMEFTFLAHCKAGPLQKYEVTKKAKQ